MQVKDIMTKEVVTVTIDTEVKSVADILTRERIHGVPVVDQNKKVIGIITETNFFANAEDAYLSNFVKNIKENKLPNKETLKNENEINSQTTAESIMTKDCITVSPEMDLEELFAVFRKKAYHTIPVVDNEGVLLGVVTIADIIAASTKIG